MAGEDQRKEITRLLEAVRLGDQASNDKLFALVYEELRRMAHAKMRLQKPGQTLQTTALVHEAYLKLFSGKQSRFVFEDRRHFFGAAANAMRQILVDKARERRADKRGGDGTRVALDHEFAEQERPADLLALDQALDGLAGHHTRPARVVALRYFLGLSIDETAEILGLSPRTVNADWTLAKAWLKRELTRPGGAVDG